ncbi:EF-hand calcium-binding domain-containing protein 7 isoform X2 [Rhinatrema bivittatum]|uniref:EF-hand calcium-binding domain-containing protein 7 isoform X2 n=1 Tax=Rhinatrema bivittatum TaxID=194408 RepID=UPI00112CB5B9|nr:EF-hand calcium-binding domain-containing protein 7 isoform X2 [Rhinatrema bivittatum]
MGHFRPSTSTSGVGATGSHGNRRSREAGLPTNWDRESESRSGPAARMAGCPASKPSLSGQKCTLAENSEEKKAQSTEEEIFYVACRAAYLTVFRSSLENIASKEQLCLVLQHAGRNPSLKTLNKYWTAKTKGLNFDDFCAILRKENPATKTELLKAFQKIDPGNTGYILHEDLYQILTTRGEKMSQEEVNAIINLTDVNNSGRLDYNKFCKLYIATKEQCLKTASEKLEADSKLRQQHFGSHAGKSPECTASSASKPAPRSPGKTNLDPIPKKVDRSARPLSARSYKASVSSIISMGANSAKNSKLIEPNTIKEWQCTQSKGCFFLEEDGEIVTHRYRLHIPQKSTVYLTIKPLNLSQIEGKPSQWISVDTAVYVLKEDEDEDLQLVCFTELRTNETFGWKGEMGSGVYWLIPFTTGCRLRKKRKHVTAEARLVHRDESNDLVLTKEFRATLSDIFDVIDLDGNGLLSLEEYNFFELRTSGEKCDDDAWAVCKENFDTKKNELTRQGFIDLNLMEANDREGDPEDLWVTLESMGYNRALEMTEACPFIIDVFAEKCKPRLKATNLQAGSGQLEQAICKSVVMKGEAKVMDGYENVIIYTYKSDTRITSVIENKSVNKVVLHVNNEQSKNCVSSRGLSTFAVEVPPKSQTICQHTMPLNESQEWIYNCIQNILA